MTENLNINDFTYDLPKEKIAKFPLAKRSESKLLCFKDNQISHDFFYNINKYISNNAFIVRNSTKVIYARIRANKLSGGKAEVLCVEPVEPSNDPQIALNATSQTVWKCIIGGKKINTGSELMTKLNDKHNLKMSIIEKNANEALVSFQWNSGVTFSQILDYFGEIPLPPYLERESTQNDNQTYQTVYANKEGSVAAPTAGLHFDEETINKLKENGVNFYDLVLHVGPGTFLPVTEDLIKNHKMHQENIFVPVSLLRNIYSELTSNKQLIAIGTTTLRTLESVYQYGYLLSKSNTKLDFEISQWDSYFTNQEITFKQSLEAIFEYYEDNEVLAGKTSILIAPGYKFKTADALITNFHQPKSTLLLLISAFIGEENTKRVYQSALEQNYRFLSYGDSSILYK